MLHANKNGMSVGWYCNRLRTMGALEIAYRFLEAAKKKSAKGLLEGWDRFDHVGSSPSIPWMSHLAKSLFDMEWCMKYSETILRGEFCSLGRQWPKRSADRLFPMNFWTIDPVTGCYWPGKDTYCFDIDYRTARDIGDVKYVWEANRLQFLQPLAMVAATSSAHDVVRAIEAAISSWYEANPPFRGLSWSSGIELALRSISLLFVTSVCGEKLSRQAILKIRRILNAHAYWLKRFPSLFSSCNNHRIAEASGELLISMAMPEMLWSTNAGKRARNVLEVEAQKQFYPDGVPAEQSPSYGAFSAELLLICDRVCQAMGNPLSPNIMRRISQFAEFIAWLSYGDGNVPQIGDCDDARVLLVAPAAPSYPLHVVRQIAAPSRSAMGIKTFREGGYTVIREVRSRHEIHLILDHGPLGYLSIAAHGHADALSVIAMIDGKPLFVDPGTYLYHSGGKWRDWFRSTPAHNTLNINGESQSEIAGAFMWSRKANTYLEYVRGGRDWRVSATHDGYLSRFGVIHRRIAFPVDDGFALLDELLGKGNIRAEISFQLAEDLEARCQGRNQVIVSRSGKDIAVLIFSLPGEVLIIKGGEPGFCGWYSPSFGLKIPAFRVSWRGDISSEGMQTYVKLQ